MTNQHKKNLHNLGVTWDQFGKDDPLWAILADQDKRRNKWDRDEFFATGVAEIDDAMSYVTEQVGQPTPGKALDFGCGVGRCTQALARHFSSCVGVDISSSMIELAEEFNQEPERCSYVLNTVDYLRHFADLEFDFVYSARVLQHMPSSLAERYIEEFLRVTKRGGIVLFQLTAEHKRTPGASRFKSAVKPLLGDALLKLYRRMRYGTPAEMEMHVISESRVRQILANEGGRVIDVVNDEFAGANYMSLRYCVVKN